MKFTKKKAAIAYQLISFLLCVRPSFFWRVYVFSAVCPLSGGFHLDRIRGVSSYDMIKRWWDRSFRAALMVASLESLE